MPTHPATENPPAWGVKVPGESGREWGGRRLFLEFLLPGRSASPSGHPGVAAGRGARRAGPVLLVSASHPAAPDPAAGTRWPWINVSVCEHTIDTQSQHCPGHVASTHRDSPGSRTPPPTCSDVPRPLELGRPRSARPSERERIVPLPLDGVQLTQGLLLLGKVYLTQVQRTLEGQGGRHPQGESNKLIINVQRPQPPMEWVLGSPLTGKQPCHPTINSDSELHPAPGSLSPVSVHSVSGSHVLLLLTLLQGHPWL